MAAGVVVSDDAGMSTEGRGRRWLGQVWTGVGAIAVGFTVTFLCRVALSPLSGLLRQAIGGGVGRRLGAVVIPAVLPVVGALVSGAVVARLYRDERRVATGWYLGFVLLLSLPRGAAMLGNAVSDSRYLPALGVYGLNLLLVGGALLAGARLGGGASPRPVVSVRDAGQAGPGDAS